MYPSYRTLRIRLIIVVSTFLALSRIPSSHTPLRAFTVQNPPQLLNDLAQDRNPQSCILFPHDSFTMSLKNRIQSNVSKKDSLN